MELNAVTAAGWLHVLAEEKQQHHIKEALPEKNTLSFPDFRNQGGGCYLGYPGQFILTLL